MHRPLNTSWPVGQGWDYQQKVKAANLPDILPYMGNRVLVLYVCIHGNTWIWWLIPVWSQNKHDTERSDLSSLYLYIDTKSMMMVPWSCRDTGSSDRLLSIVQLVWLTHPYVGMRHWLIPVTWFKSTILWSGLSGVSLSLGFNSPPIVVSFLGRFIHSD